MKFIPNVKIMAALVAGLAANTLHGQTQITAPNGLYEYVVEDGEFLLVSEDRVNNIDPFTVDQGGDLQIGQSTLTNYARLTNSGLFINEGILDNFGTLENFGRLDNVGTLRNYETGTINSDNPISNYRLYNAGTINGGIDVKEWGGFSNSGIINGDLGMKVGVVAYNSGIINGDVNVETGVEMIGDGTINGSILLGGRIRPGFFVGSVTTGDQTWIDGGRYRWQINDGDGTAGADAGWDLVNITATTGDNGVLDLSQLTRGSFGIELVTLNDLNQNRNPAKGFDDPNGEYEFVILTTEGGITGFEAEDFVIDSSAFINSGLWYWSIAQDGNNLVLRATGYTIIDYINYIIDYVSDDEVIFDSDWKNKRMRDAFILKLEAVLEIVVAAEAAEDSELAALLYLQVAEKVDNDLIALTDGLQGIGSRTRDDWILVQEAQDILYPDLLSLSDYLWLKLQ